jgi:hypothetical protein
MRHYYDVASLLKDPDVQAFVGTEEYFSHKTQRFPRVDKEAPIVESEAFNLSNAEIRERLAKAYEASAALYYEGQPPFEELLATIQAWAPKL